MADHNNPQSRNEEILIATIDGKEYNKAPQSRMEELLLELKETIEEGGGGGGTTNYENLSNQPQVNGETLIGDKTGADLGLVDAEEGKGLSTNDYDDTEKAAVAAATSAISAMKDGSELDSFGDVEVALLDKADISDLGTAAAKNSTNTVTSGSTDLVESGAVKDAIDAAVAAAYHHAGTKTVAQLTHDLLIASNEGNVYNITDSGTTTSDFIEGIGKTIDEGSNVGICKVGDVYMFDLLSGFVDTTNFVQKSQTSGLLKNDGTVNTTIENDVDQLKSGLTNATETVDISNQYTLSEKVSSFQALKRNNVVTITLRTSNEAHSGVETLATIPQALHPLIGSYSPVFDFSSDALITGASGFLSPSEDKIVAIGTYTGRGSMSFTYIL